jgi:hypothetical protein
MFFESTLMVFTVQEISLKAFFLYHGCEATGSYMHEMYISCLISTMEERGNGVAHKGRLSLLFPRCFTMLPSEGKRTIARALKKQSVRPCDVFVIGIQVEKLDWCLVKGGKSENIMKHGKHFPSSLEKKNTYVDQVF